MGCPAILGAQNRSRTPRCIRLQRDPQVLLGLSCLRLAVFDSENFSHTGQHRPLRQFNEPDFWEQSFRKAARISSLASLPCLQTSASPTDCKVILQADFERFPHAKGCTPPLEHVQDGDRQEYGTSFLGFLGFSGWCIFRCLSMGSYFGPHLFSGS